MKLIVCVVRDAAADVYGRPFFAVATGEAIRSFTDEVNRNAADNIMAKHPQDFELFELGHYNDEDATLDVGVPRSLIRGSDAVIKTN